MSFLVRYGPDNSDWQLVKTAFSNLVKGAVTESKGRNCNSIHTEGIHNSQYIKISKSFSVRQGILVDTSEKTSEINLDQFFNRGSIAKRNPLADCEGAFAITIWDNNLQQGFFSNDHAANRNLYYFQHNKNLYVTTVPIALAKAFSLNFDDYGLQQFLVRGVILAPYTLFQGIFRLNVGEIGKWINNKLEITTVWTPIVESSNLGLRQCADLIAETITDRIQRVSSQRSNSVADLTGGLDSRVLNLARSRSSEKISVTVNGSEDHPDVKIAHELASKMNWTIHHFSKPTPALDYESRHKLSLMTSGELAFESIAHQQINRPALANMYDLHMTGSGGELMRFYAWSHEFWNIGRRKPASVERTLNYRYSQYGKPPRFIMSDNGYRDFQYRLGSDIRRWFDSAPGTLTTQQQDALYIWKMTSHVSLYTSSLSHWITMCSPLLMHSCLEAMISVPWRHRVSSKLQRTVNQVLSPKGASVRTEYGGPAGEATISDLPYMIDQSITGFSSLTKKVIRVISNNDRMPAMPNVKPNYISAEFKKFIEPEELATSDLYELDGLQDYVSGSDVELSSRSIYLSRIATLEHIRREVRS